MIRVNIHEAKTHLSRLLEQIAAGETILLCRRNVPVAEIRPVAEPSREPRPLGPRLPGLEVSPGFFDPLPDDLLSAFGGAGA